jgi:hypothetical protein
MENLKGSLNIADIYDKLQIVHSETVDSYVEGIEFMIDNKCTADAVTYNHTNKFTFADLKTDDDGNFFYEYSPYRDVDIINNIRFESSNGAKAKLSYCIGCVYQSEMDEFLSMVAQYNQFKIRVTFLDQSEIPTVEDELMVHSRVYILELPVKKILAKYVILTKHNRYENGMCYSASGKDTCEFLGLK